MNDKYEVLPAKSSTLKEDFCELLCALADITNSQLPPILIKHYYDSFKQIGFDVGVKGLKQCFIALPRRLPDVVVICELAGKPYVRPLTTPDKAALLASRTLSAVHQYKSNRSAIKSQVGELGLALIDLLGGYEMIASSKQDQHFYILKQATTYAEIVIKQHPQHPELETIAQKPQPYIQSGPVKYFLPAIVETNHERNEPGSPELEAFIKKVMARRKKQHEQETVDDTVVSH